MTIDLNWKYFIDIFRNTSNNLKNFEDFLNWPIIKQTMFIGNPQYVNIELDYLKKLNNWPDWSTAIIENNIGNPEIFPNYPSSSGNLIHHAYHVALFENITNLKINSFDTVFEFGGGYGSMCRLFRNLNYKNKYIICDLEEFTSLQKYYLSKLNMSCEFLLEKELNSYEFTGKKMFIATWSLSETPENLINYVTNKVSNFDAFLIAFNRTFINGDNPRYFENFIKGIGDIKYSMFEIDHMKDNFYLIGAKNNGSTNTTTFV